jgi:hypothetical protein
VPAGARLIHETPGRESNRDVGGMVDTIRANLGNYDAVR